MLTVHPDTATQWRDRVPAGAIITQEERQGTESVELGLPGRPGNVPCPVSSRLDRLQNTRAFGDGHLPTGLTHLSPGLQGDNSFPPLTTLSALSLVSGWWGLVSSACLFV